MNGCTSGRVLDVPCLADRGVFGWLVIKKGDILSTDGVPIKGEASHFKSKVCDTSPHSIAFQPNGKTSPMMVFTLQMMLHKLVVVRTNLLISINWT